MFDCDGGTLQEGAQPRWLKMARPLRMGLAIGLTSLLQAHPARFTLDAVRMRASRPVVSQQLELRMVLNGRGIGEATLLYAEGEAHVAFKNDLGTHGPVVRIAAGMVSLQPRPEHTFLAPDAVVAVRELFGASVRPDVLVDLMMGRAPRGEWHVVEGGFQVVADGLKVWVDRQGAVVRASLASTALAFDEEGFVLRRGGQSLRVVIEEREERPIPKSAFTLAATAKLHLLGR